MISYSIWIAVSVLFMVIKGIPVIKYSDLFTTVTNPNGHVRSSERYTIWHFTIPLNLTSSSVFSTASP